MKRNEDCRDWHYLTKLNTTNVPSSLMVVSTASYVVPDARMKNKQWHHLRMYVANAFRMERGEISREVNTSGNKHEAFWEDVHGRLDSKRPLWIFCHDLGKTMTLLQLWKRVIDKTYEFCQYHEEIDEDGDEEQRSKWSGLAVLADPPSFIKMRLAGTTKTVVIVDLQNYFREPITTIAESLGIQGFIRPQPNCPEQVAADYCYQECQVIREAITSLIELVRTENLGRFSYTAPALSMAAYRSRFLRDSRTILVHGNETALNVERESYHTGAVHCWYIGQVLAGQEKDCELWPITKGIPHFHGQVYHYDIQSFYPSLMRDHLFPSRLVKVLRNPSFDLVEESMREFAVIARCKLDCKTVGYPVTRFGKTNYAVGKLATSLAGPELQRALARSNVMAVHVLSLYEREPLFRDFAEFFLGQRAYYKSKGNLAFATVCKLIANSLYGKFAQWRNVWDDQPDMVPPFPLGEWFDQRPPTEEEIIEGLKNQTYASREQAEQSLKTVVYRSICWLAQVKGHKQEHKDSCPAIASYLTAYGRERILALAQTAGIENCLYSDTDSLHVTAEGSDSLVAAGEVAPGTPGKLVLKDIYDWCEYRGPKDYTTSQGRVIAGVKEDAEVRPDGSFKQSKFQRLSSIIRGQQLDGVAEEGTTFKLPQHGYFAEIEPTGRTKPILIKDW